MFARTAPVLGSFDVLELVSQGQQQLLLPGVLPEHLAAFCTVEEANAIAAEINRLLNAGTDGSNGSASVSEDLSDRNHYVVMAPTAPRLYQATGSFSQQQQTFPVSERLGELLSRQTLPDIGIDKAPYKNPASPVLGFSVVAGNVRFFWS